MIPCANAAPIDSPSVQARRPIAVTDQRCNRNMQHQFGFVTGAFAPANQRGDFPALYGDFPALFKAQLLPRAELMGLQIIGDTAAIYAAALPD